MKNKQKKEGKKENEIDILKNSARGKIPEEVLEMEPDISALKISELAQASVPSVLGKFGLEIYQNKCACVKSFGVL